MEGNANAATRRSIITKVIAGSAGLTTGLAVGAGTSAANPHPDWDIISDAWSSGDEYRGIPAGPVVTLDPEGGGYSWEEVCDVHSREYADAILRLDVFQRFNDRNGVEGNIEAHELTWVRDRLAPTRDYSLAGIQLWERGNPLNRFSNISPREAEQLIEADDKYDQILCEENPTYPMKSTIEEEWRGCSFEI